MKQLSYPVCSLIGTIVLLTPSPYVSRAAAVEVPISSIHSASPTLVVEHRKSDQAASHDQSQQMDAVTDYPVVVGETWMIEEGVPWSELVWIQKENQEDYVAVLDRFFDAEPNIDNPGISSLWSRQQLEVYGYGHCVYCPVQHPAYPVTAASLKVGDRVFHLQGNQSFFDITEKVAWALKNAHAQTNDVWLRIAIAGGSNYTTRPIGSETIAAWQILYRDAEVGEVAALPEASLTPVSRVPDDIPSDLPVVQESSWRQQSGVVWSEPVIVHDDFNGDYLAVLDRSYESGGVFTGEYSGILTNWSSDQLAIHLYEQDDDYVSISYQCWAVGMIGLQIGEQIFYLQGENNIFSISDDLAKVLASQPSETPMLIYPRFDGELIIREIGPKTVEAWGLIYGSANVDHQDTDG